VSLRSYSTFHRSRRRCSARALSLLAIAASILFATASHGHASRARSRGGKARASVARPDAPAAPETFAARGGKAVQHAIPRSTEPSRALRRLVEDEQVRLGMEGRAPRVIGKRTIEEPGPWTRYETLVFTATGIRRQGYSSALKYAVNSRHEIDVPVSPDTIEALLATGEAFVGLDGNPIDAGSIERAVDASQLRSIAARRTGVASAIDAFAAGAVFYPAMGNRVIEIGSRWIAGTDGPGRTWTREERLVLSSKGLQVISSTTSVEFGMTIVRPNGTRPATADLATTGPEFTAGPNPITAKGILEAVAAAMPLEIPSDE
jgi:hypothetical protein